MIDYQRLNEILKKKDMGYKLNAIDIQDFSRITRSLKTQDYQSFGNAIRPHYTWAWFHRYMFNELNTIFDNKSGRLLLAIGDQHGKTEIAARLAVPYLMGKNPNFKVLYITYSDERAKEPAADILDIMASDEYGKLFPNFKLKDDITEEVRTAKKRANKLTITNFTNANSPRPGKTGEFKAVGITGSITGFDADVIIVDDPFSGYAEASSKTIRDTRWNIFVGNILSRQQKNVIIIVFCTWWHPEDINGRLRQYIKDRPIIAPNAPEWKLIEFNSLKDERYYPYDPRKIGEYLWPEMKMDTYLEQQALSIDLWMVKHQNLPIMSSGKVFDSECFRYYDEVPNLAAMRIVISVDPNYKKEAKAGDDCAIVVLGFMSNKIYLLDFSAVNKVDVIDNINRIRTFIQKYPDYHAILIEDAAQGEDIVTLLKHQRVNKIQKFIPQGQSKGSNAKLYRSQTMIPYCRAGQFYVPSTKLNGNINFYINQFLNFTGIPGNKDDCVDATTQAFIEFKYLLEPIKLGRMDYTIKNDFNIGVGLSRISRPFMVGNNEKNKKYSQGRYSTNNR